MFNFHEKIKKQIGTGFGANWGRSLMAFLHCEKATKLRPHWLLKLFCFILLPSTYPDNNLHAIITVSSYI